MSDVCGPGGLTFCGFLGCWWSSPPAVRAAGSALCDAERIRLWCHHRRRRAVLVMPDGQKLLHTEFVLAEGDQGVNDRLAALLRS